MEFDLFVTLYIDENKSMKDKYTPPQLSLSKAEAKSNVLRRMDPCLPVVCNFGEMKPYGTVSALKT
jgi:hypothetical protein